MMQLNELDKKSLIALKDKIEDLKYRVKEVSTVTAKSGVPLEELLELSPSYKAVWDDTYSESKVQAMDMLNERGESGSYVCGKRLTYSLILESGKRYVQVGEGVIGLFALKIMAGEGVFEFKTAFKEKEYLFCTFTAIPEEKYVLFDQGLIFNDTAGFIVKELEGHIRYVLAMSTFLNPEIVEVK